MLVEHCQYTCPGGWEIRRVRSTLSDSDNIAISVQVQLELELPTGTELGNNASQSNLTGTGTELGIIYAI